MRPDPLEDFFPDRAGLQSALAELVDRLARPNQEAGTALRLPPALPEHGLGPHEALSQLVGSAVGGARRLDGPGFFAHMDPPTPWMAWAAAQWSAALNQNLLHPDTAPIARDLEALVIGWLAPFFGMSGGHLVPGSTIANLTGLWAARELRGVREVVASEAAHLSVPKAARLLGLGYRTVAVDRAQRLRPDELGDVSRSAVVLTAGTVAAGAIDPLDAGAGAAWRHVDAAWAGPLRLSDLHMDLLEGVERADSISFSAHKWLFQPKECGVILFRDSASAHEALSFGGGYLRAPNVGLLGSHGASALPLAATLLAWGREGVAALLEHCMRLADRLAQRIAIEPVLELFAPPTTGVVLWRPREAVDLEQLRGRLQRAFVSSARIGDQDWLRSVAANPMADPDLIVDDVLNAM